jgi:hypothetical protein
MSGTKVSPVDAATVALGAVDEPPAWSMRVLDGATLEWCRALSLPTARTLAHAIGRAPSTIVRHGGLVGLYAEVIRREWTALDERWFSAHPRARAAYFRQHVAELLARDPVMLRLPGLVLAAVATAGAPVPARLAVPWFSLAAFAADADDALALSA